MFSFVTTSYTDELITVIACGPDLIISNLLTLTIIGILLTVCSFIHITFANVLFYVYTIAIIYVFLLLLN